MTDKFQISFNEELVQELCNLCDMIEKKLNKNEDAQGLIEEFNSQVNHIPHETSFNQYYSWTEQEDFIKSLLLPIVVKDKSISKEELISLIQRVVDCKDYKEVEEYDMDYWFKILEVNLCQNISDLVYHDDELTAEEIYERVLEKKREE